jgi:hypothetical protein
MTANSSAGEAPATVKEADYLLLTAAHVPPCISIYLMSNPVETAQQRFVRLRSMLRAAESRLRNFSMSVDEAESLLASVARVIEAGQKPHPAAQGLAIFMSKDSVSYRYLRETVAESVVVGNEFFVRPLLPLVPRDDRFFLLELSQKQVRLYEGSASGISERALEGVPENVREDFKGHGFEREYQLHTASSRSSGQKGAVFHGPSLDEKDRIAHFLRDVERGVATALKGQQAPLILAAVEYLVPIYKSVNTYAHLSDEAIIGSPHLLGPNELYTAAWRIVEKDILKHEQGAFAVYQEHANTPLTSSNLRQILSEAQRGLIRFLFVSPSAERWGSMTSPETVHLHSTQEPGDSDLLNLAATLTLHHGGQVFVGAPNQLPEGAEAAAVFRFALGSQGVT